MIHVRPSPRDEGNNKFFNINNAGSKGNQWTFSVKSWKIL